MYNGAPLLYNKNDFFVLIKNFDRKNAMKLLKTEKKSNIITLLFYCSLKMEQKAENQYGFRMKGFVILWTKKKEE